VSDENIAYYRVYSIAVDGTMSPISNIPKEQTSYVHIGLISGVNYSYVVKAIDHNEYLDKNSKVVNVFTYQGVSTATVTGMHSAHLVFPSAPSAISLRIYCALTGSGYQLIETLTATANAYDLVNLQAGDSYRCKVNAEGSSGEDGNLINVEFKLPDLSFAGVSSVLKLADDKAMIAWSAGLGVDIAGYHIYSIDVNTNLKIIVGTVSSESNSFLVTSASAGSGTFSVRAISSGGIADDNTISLLPSTYAGISSATATGQTSGIAYFPSAPGMEQIVVDCRPTGGTYSPGATATISANATSVSVDGLASGRTHFCRARVKLNGWVYDSSNIESSLLTVARTLADYRGPVLISAYGASPGAPSGPTVNQVNITFRYFGDDSAAIQSYAVQRVGADGSLDMTVGTSCNSSMVTSCRVCTFTNVSDSQTCTDNYVAASPQKYDYVVSLVGSDAMAEELPSDLESKYRIRVPIPPANMVLVHRDSVNYELCNLMGKTSDPLNHQRCATSGSSMIGAIPYNSGSDKPALNLPAGYYDFGYNLFVDRFHAACKWDATGTSVPSAGTSGVVYYDSNSGYCYVKYGGSWYEIGNSLTALDGVIGLVYSNEPSTAAPRPPLTYLSQTRAWKICQAAVDPDYGQKRLLRRREYIAAAAWPSAPGDPNAVTDTVIVTREFPPSGNHVGSTSYPYSCNSDNANGLTLGTFAETGYQLARSNTTTTTGSMTLVIGSTATKNCVSRFGMQDHVGNIFSWTSDLISCDTSNKTCIGLSSALDNGNGISSSYDLNGVHFDGIQAAGGTSCTGSCRGSLNGSIFSSMYFNFSLGLPMVSDDNGNSRLISVDVDKLHQDYFDLDVGASTAVLRGLYSGGHSAHGSGVGRWNTIASRPETSEYFDVGMRCALPAE
jgi:hypothetical protein